MVLDNVSIEMTPDDVDLNTVLQPTILVPAARIDYDATESVYIACRKAPGSAPVGSYSTVLKYTSLTRDPVSGEIVSDEGFEDEYGLEDLDIQVGDYVVSSHVSNFDADWEELGEDNEAVEGYQLNSITTLAGECLHLCIKPESGENSNISGLVCCSRYSQSPRDARHEGGQRLRHFRRIERASHHVPLWPVLRDHEGTGTMQAAHHGWSGPCARSRCKV